MELSQDFTHHGSRFVIEAADWPSMETAHAAVIELHVWALQLGPPETAALHEALEREREALVAELPYDRNAPPLPAVRNAQRQAIRAGLGGRKPPEGMQPTVTIEAHQLTEAPS